MTRREWQLFLKRELTTLQYRYVEVNNEATWLEVLDPRTMKPVLRVKLGTLGEVLDSVRGALANVQVPDNPEVTIIPHWPGP